MQQIFSTEEMRDRATLTLFLQEYFAFKTKTTSTFKYALPVNTLWHIYSACYPETKLSVDDLRLYFTILGVSFLDKVFVELRAQHISELPAKLFSQIHAHLTSSTLRALDLSSAATIRNINPSVKAYYEFQRRFLKTTSKDARTRTARIHAMYVQFCLDQDIAPVSNKRLVQLLAENVSGVRRGHADGKSGVNYVVCTIPPDEYWERSLHYGVGLFNYMEGIYDNLGKRLNLDSVTLEVLDPVTALYLRQRVEGEAYEQAAEESRAQEEEATKAQDGRAIDWRTAESLKEAVRSRKKTREASAGDSTDEAGHRAAKKRATPGDRASGTSEDAADRGEVTGDTTANLYGDDKLVFTTLDGLDLLGEESSGGIEAESLDLIMASAEDEDDVPVDSTLQEVFEAMEIVYKINPATFTPRTMDAFLTSMEVTYTAEEIWDEFMDYIAAPEI